MSVSVQCLGHEAHHLWVDSMVVSVTIHCPVWSRSTPSTSRIVRCVGSMQCLIWPRSTPSTRGIVGRVGEDGGHQSWSWVHSPDDEFGRSCNN